MNQTTPRHPHYNKIQQVKEKEAEKQSGGDSERSGRAQKGLRMMKKTERNLKCKDNQETGHDRERGIKSRERQRLS